MQLYDASWQQPGGATGLTGRHIIRGLVVPKTVTDKFKTEDILETVAATTTAEILNKDASPILKNLQHNLQRKIRRTIVEIKAEIHSRLVFGIGCVPVILIGIGLGIIKKGGHLLSAFGVSSIPAAVLIVCIMMGKNITKNPGAGTVSGTVLMWAGLVFLLMLALVIYRKLLRH